MISISGEGGEGEGVEQDVSSVRGELMSWSRVHKLFRFSSKLLSTKMLFSPDPPEQWSTPRLGLRKVVSSTGYLVTINPTCTSVSSGVPMTQAHTGHTNSTAIIMALPTWSEKTGAGHRGHWSLPPHASPSLHQYTGIWEFLHKIMLQ